MLPGVFGSAKSGEFPVVRGGAGEPVLRRVADGQRKHGRGEAGRREGGVSDGDAEGVDCDRP